jgi:hypothetical protein
MALPKSLLALASTLALTAPAQADPTIGLGLSLSFGGGAPQAGVGLRLFSDNTPDSIAGSLGVDYLLKSKAWRGTVGAAYLGDYAYIGLDMGLGFGGGGLDFGFSGGAVDTATPGSDPEPEP